MVALKLREGAAFDPKAFFDFCEKQVDRRRNGSQVVPGLRAHRRGFRVHRHAEDSRAQLEGRALRPEQDEGAALLGASAATQAFKQFTLGGLPVHAGEVRGGREAAAAGSLRYAAADDGRESGNRQEVETDEAIYEDHRDNGDGLVAACTESVVRSGGGGHRAAARRFRRVHQRWSGRHRTRTDESAGVELQSEGGHRHAVRCLHRQHRLDGDGRAWRKKRRDDAHTRPTILRPPSRRTLRRRRSQRQSGPAEDGTRGLRRVSRGGTDAGCTGEQGCEPSRDGESDARIRARVRVSRTKA